jgi:hypothetical protein
MWDICPYIYIYAILIWLNPKDLLSADDVTGSVLSVRSPRHREFAALPNKRYYMAMSAYMTVQQ